MMMNAKNPLLTAALCLIGAWAYGQAAYVLPSPTGASEEVTLYIDISQSVDGTSNNALKAILADHPEDDVYLWTWQPAGPVNGNGNWDDSADHMKLNHEGGLLYSLTFVPTEFYGVDGPTFFANGISCLAKLDNGNEYDGEYNGEAKTEDFTIDIVPKLCDANYCIFPEIGEASDYIHFTYDNGQETFEGLQDINPDQVYLHLIAKTGPFTSYSYVPASETPSTPELKMEQVVDEPDFYRLIILPEDFFDIPEGEEITEIIYYVLTPGFSYPGPPPNNIYGLLDCTD